MRRFIDDVFGRWYGTVRQFEMFVNVLNQISQPYGIQFGGHQIGKEVNFLDVCLYLDNEEQIQYKLHRKPTDARLYVKTDSFHPPHTFLSVAFSQMIRVINRNSTDVNCVKDMEDLRADLMKSGHSEDKLLELEPKAVLRCMENEHGRVKPKGNSRIMFSITYMKEIEQLKKLVRSLDDDIKRLCGEVDIIFALKKNPAIRDVVIKNRNVSKATVTMNHDPVSDYKCRARNCLTCELVFDKDEEIIVNGLRLCLKPNSNCKTKSIVYVAQCQLCIHDDKGLTEDTYFGQTVSPLHIRVNGHRSKFNDNHYQESALSMHMMETHANAWNINHFKFGVVKQVKPVDLNREEERFIDKFKTNLFGLNRINVIR